MLHSLLELEYRYAKRWNADIAMCVRTRLTPRPLTIRNSRDNPTERSWVKHYIIILITCCYDDTAVSYQFHEPSPRAIIRGLRTDA